MNSRSQWSKLKQFQYFYVYFKPKLMFQLKLVQSAVIYVTFYAFQTSVTFLNWVN